MPSLRLSLQNEELQNRFQGEELGQVPAALGSLWAQGEQSSDRFLLSWIWILLCEIMCDFPNTSTKHLTSHDVQVLSCSFCHNLNTVRRRDRIPELISELAFCFSSIQFALL